MWWKSAVRGISAFTLSLVINFQFSPAPLAHAADGEESTGAPAGAAAAVTAPMTACPAILAAMKAVAPDAAASAKLLEEKHDLEIRMGRMIAQRQGLSHQTRIRGTQIFERALSLLARGDASELAMLIQPISLVMLKNAKILRDTAVQIETLRATSTADRLELARLEEKFRGASVPFGENYGTYVMLMSLLASVVEGKGVSNSGPIPLQARGAETDPVIFDLTSAAARETAQAVQAILDPHVETTYLPNSAVSVYSPSVDEFRGLFQNNIYALLAKLRHDLAEQQRDRRWWVRSIRVVADAYMNVTSAQIIPERYRKWILRVAGVPYDRFMLEKYLDRIQALVDVARVRAPDGNVVLSTDPTTLDLQIKTLFEFSTHGVGDDFLITFARIGYHTDVWSTLLTAVQKKGAGDANSAYTHLHQRMLNAQKRAMELPGLPYIYESTVTYKIVFASLQIIYLVGTEEAVRHWIGPFFYRMYHYFF
ncbi:MAG: hypothetical protein AB7G93_17105 [Bdellovibrionales bacterium]